MDELRKVIEEIKNDYEVGYIELDPFIGQYWEYEFYVGTEYHRIIVGNDNVLYNMIDNEKKYEIVFNLPLELFIKSDHDDIIKKINEGVYYSPNIYQE